MTGATSAVAARLAVQQAGGGAIPTVVLHDLLVIPIPHRYARKYVERNHYLHFMPGGTEFAFGVKSSDRLRGAITFGAVRPTHTGW